MEGFTTVYKYTGKDENLHGAYATNVNLDEYSIVRFAIKTGKYNFNNASWDESNEWLLFTLVQTDTAVWTLTVTKNGAVVHTASGLSGNRNDGSYSYNALDSILYGIPTPGYSPWNVNGSITVYTTEVRGDISTGDVDVTDTGISFLVKSNGDKWSYDTGTATVSLTDLGLDIPSVTAILIDGEPFAGFSINNNEITLKNAPGGDHVYTFIYGEVGYNVNGCVYANGISTVAELEDWRTNESRWYTVLLNDINYSGQTLTTNSENVIGVLDGRGYTISNFTHTTGFVSMLYGTESVIKNVSFKGVTHNVSTAANKSLGLFGSVVDGTIENIYLEMATIGGTGEHYGVLVNIVNGVAKNIIVNITSSYADVAHYIMARNEATTLENVYGVYSSSLFRWSNNHGVEEYPIDYTYKTAKQLTENHVRTLILGGYWKNTYDSLQMNQITQEEVVEVEDNYLVKGGKTEYVVVIEDANADDYSMAAQELYSLFYEATGIKLTFVSSLNAEYNGDAKYIYLGNGDFGGCPDVNLEELGSQGFALKTQGQSVFIIANPQGVLYGVYEFLHVTLNFETYTKEIYTLNKGVTELAFPDLDITQVPDVEYRIAFSGVQYDDEVSRRRMRTQNSSEVVVYGGGAHNMTLHIVPFDTYYKTNPAWFSSKTNSLDTYESTQLCYTAGGRGTTSYNQMLQVAYDNVVALLAKDPTKTIMSLTQMDLDNMWCQCSACRSIIDTYGANSATQILFINDLTSRVQTWLDSQGGRKVQFLMFAYYDSIDAPTKGNLKLNDNVSVWIAPINDNYMVDVNNSSNELGKALTSWKNVASSVAIWAYNVYFDNYLVPYNSYDKIDQLIDACVASNVSFMWVQGNWNTTQNTGFDSLKAYLIAKLMWDSTADVNKLTNDYFNAVYGPAASDMLNVYNVMKQQLNSMSLNGNIYKSPSAYSWDTTYLKEQLDRLVAAIGKLDKSDANYQKYYDAIVCESISFRYIYEQQRRKTYSTSVWGTFAEETKRLGFTQKSEQDKL